MRIVGIAVSLVLVAVLALIQLASAAIFSAAGVPGSLPARLAPATGAHLYDVLTRIAPLPSFEAMLARYDIAIGDATAAQRAAQRLPDSAVRDELFARIALLRGDRAGATEYFLAAPDVDAIQSVVGRQAWNDPKGAYRLEARLLDRLTAMTVHPDAVAEAYWHLGTLGPYAGASPQVAMQNLERAVAMAPYNEKYLLAAARESLRLGNPAQARSYYQRGMAVDPTSFKAAAGLAKLQSVAP